MKRKLDFNNVEISDPVLNRKIVKKASKGMKKKGMAIYPIIILSTLIIALLFSFVELFIYNPVICGIVVMLITYASIRSVKQIFNVKL